MKKQLYFSLLVLIAFSACKSDSDTPEGEDTKKSEASKIEEKTGFQEVEILFDDKKFGSADEKALLDELKICSTDPELTTNSEIAPCSPENFKFLPLRKDLSIKNGFILLIKAETAGFPLRRMLVFQRERGELVKANGFVANIIGRVSTSSGYDDLLLRFQDKDGEGKMWYNCTFTWKDGTYEYKQVERIEGPNWGGPVIDKYKKETSKDVYQAITDNKMIF
jgi:hypothetical protein